MPVDNIRLVSVNECIRKMCFPDNPKASINALISKFTNLYLKYVYENARCYRADAEDRTKHILVDFDIVLQVFCDPEFVGNVKLKRFDDSIFNSKYQNLEITCCCIAKKLKNALISAESFSDFVKAGPVALNTFNRLKSQLDKIVSLDIEAFEFDHNKILEIGLIIYDMRTKRTEAYHIIINDHVNLFNGKYVSNNKENFNFGTSHRMSMADAIKFAVHHLTQPNTCLLGHNIKADIDFLRKSSSHKISVPVFDTQAIYKYHTLSQQPAALSKVLDDLKITYSNLHNAGNDAAYTLLAFKKLAKL